MDDAQALQELANRQADKIRVLEAKLAIYEEILDFLSIYVGDMEAKIEGIK